MKTVEKILLRRKHMVMVDHCHTPTSKDGVEAFVVSALKNVQALGFTFSQPLFEALLRYTKEEFSEFYKELVPALKELVGADVKYNPMYPNFPEQVANAEEAELFINAIIHYWSFGTLLPNYEVEERLPLIDSNEFKVLEIGTHADLMSIFTNLCSSKTSISLQDKEDIATIINSCNDYAEYLPEEIYLKENVAFIVKTIIEEAAIKSAESIQRYFKTSTDVLRLITSMSNGDISLATPTKYRKFKRSERRLFMDLLAGCGDITEDLFRYRGEWLRVAEIIHPFEYKSAKYAKVNECFNAIRNEHKPLMFGGKVNCALVNNDIRGAVDLLKTRPGDFARSLDKLLRDCRNLEDCQYVVDKFDSIADKVSTQVLLQVKEHFANRSNKLPVRVFFPKGNLAHVVSIENTLPDILNIYSMYIVNSCEKALIELYCTRDSLGKVYIDEDLKNYLVPFSQRSASKSVKSAVRGSKIPIDDKCKAVRGFIWWTNTGNGETWQDRVDIDLSAVIFNSDWKYINHISYTNLKSDKLKSYHSGDITNGGSIDGDGVAEFIDIDINTIKECGGRYVVYQIYNYTDQKFSTIPNCRFGWMEREDVNSGEIFEPTTVKMKMDLTAESTAAIPVIFDCVERSFVWCDMNLKKSLSCVGGNNLESNLRGVCATCYAMVNMRKPNLYDLISLNVSARGDIVTNRNDADIIFSNDTTVPQEVIMTYNEVKQVEEPILIDKVNVPIITAFDTDYIMGNLI